MSRYNVLVDSSVWIEYFKSGEIPVLDRLIEEDLVCTNELILTELVPILMHQGRNNLVEGLNALEMIPLKIDWKIVRKYQSLNLRNGVNKVGIPDLIVLQQVIVEKLTLFSFDKHFKLMAGFLNYNLMSS